MKKYLGIAAVIFTLSLTVTLVNAQSQNFGAKIDDQGAISMPELEKGMMTHEEMNTKVEGKVLNVCQAKGCWMTLEKSDGSKMRVTFKDYAFFVPKDISGKTVVVQGKAYINTTSVEELKHYAEDAGKSKEEIAKITAPEKELAFEAEGVIVR
jgi:hypothetical protein